MQRLGEIDLRDNWIINSDDMVLIERHNTK